MRDDPDRTDLWKRSAEYNASFFDRDFRFAAGIFTAMASGFVGIAVVLIPLSHQWVVRSWERAVVLTVQVILLVLAVLSVGYFAERYIAARRDFVERVCSDRRHELAEAVEQLGRDRELRIQDLFVLNRKQLDEYHALTVRQQGASFRNAQLAAGVSFGLLCLAVLIALQESDRTSAFAAGGLSTLGSAVSGFVAAIFFRAYDSTTVELGNYYREPLFTGQVLMIERLVDQMGNQTPSDQTQSDPREQIVSRLLELLEAPSEAGPSAAHHGLRPKIREVRSQDGIGEHT